MPQPDTLPEPAAPPAPEGDASGRPQGSPGDSPFLERLPRWVDVVLIVVAAAAVLLPRLGTYGLHDPWETHYGEVARSMVESGDWISPWWGAYWPEGEPCLKDADCGDGEICRNIRHEYLPHQATCKPKDIKREGAYFFSKPVLPMWMMALGMSAVGFHEWGVRLPFVLTSLLALLAVYLMMSHFYGRATGLLAALALLGTPLFFFISRQAVTDGPFVLWTTSGMSLLLLGAFGRRGPAPAWLRWGFVALLALLVVPQALLLAFGLKVYVRALGLKFFVGAFHALAYLALLGVVAFFVRRVEDRRRLFLLGFFVCAGLAALGKGLLGIAVPGAVVLLFLVVSGRWRLLRRLELPLGVVVFAAVAFPWYGAMFARHLRGFFDRFFIHDHFKRLASGVHSLDSGGFEYVLLWLGLGCLPWLGFVPSALRRALKGLRHPLDGEQAVRVFLVLWALVPFTLFALSSTKFHHYVFPLVPPLVLLVALRLRTLGAAGRPLQVAAVLLVALLINSIVAFDLAGDPQRLVNLFTYKYDRVWPPELDFGPSVALFGFLFALPLLWGLGRLSKRLLLATGLVVAALAAVADPELLPLGGLAVALSDGLGLASHVPAARALAAGLTLLLCLVPLAARPLLRRAGWNLVPVSLVLVALAFGTWSQVDYLQRLSDRWSQARIFHAYWAACSQGDPQQRTLADRPECAEDIAAYKMNWRGETFYSENRVIPLLSDKESRYFLGSEAGKRRFFAIVEYSRLQGQFRPLLDSKRFKSARRVYEGNSKFVLLDVPAAVAPETAPAPTPE